MHIMRVTFLKSSSLFVLAPERANVRMQQQLGASIASFLKAPQVDLLGTARVFETSREAAQSAASLLRAVNADLVALTNANATRDMSRWSAMVSGSTGTLATTSSGSSAPPRR